MKLQKFLVIGAILGGIVVVYFFVQFSGGSAGEPIDLPQKSDIQKAEPKRSRKPPPEEKEPWQQRLPVSMNGKLSSDLPNEFEQTYWHSMRLNPRLGERCDHKYLIGAKLFPDPKLDELQDCILHVDIEGMKTLIDEGADINGVGSKNVTPLFVAFFVDTDPRPFELLLEHGADPNIVSWNDVAPPVGNYSAMSVSHLTAIPQYNRLFEKVFQGSGDPNIIGGLFDDQAPPFAATTFGQPDSWERLNLMVKKGVNFEQVYGYSQKPLIYGRLRGFARVESTELREREARIILFVIENGAEFARSFELPQEVGLEALGWGGCHFTPIHFVAQASLVHELDFRNLESPLVNKLIDFLEEDGQSLEKAISDLKRWARWKSDGETDLIENEHRQREREKE
ncbi:hypothetical protein OAG68_02405 [bacterium]|nr:hypothetical protein [bacterium]